MIILEEGIRMEFYTASPEETRELGMRLGQNISAGTVLALFGDLGTGKTCFAQGVAAGLDVTDRYLPSPTFVLIREYQGRVPFYHIDLYRLTPGLDIDRLGLDEYLEGEGVSAIEWAEKLGEHLPPDAIRICLSVTGKKSRKITGKNLPPELRG